MKVNNLLKRILTTGFTVALALAALQIFASGVDGTASVAPFDVDIHYPANQVKTTAGYFDLNLGKGKSQKLSVTVKNNQSSPITIIITPYDCYTHPSGGLYYDKNPGTDRVAVTDKRFMWSGNISVKKQITVPSNGTYDLPFTITVPQVDDGEVIAALNFSTKVKPSATKATTASKAASFSFNVEKSITIAIKVNIANPTSLAKPSVGFGSVGFDATMCKVLFSLENKLPMINNGISVDYEVLNTDKSTLFSGAVNLDKMAPKTSVQVPAAWNANTVQKGNYILKANIKADNTVYSYEEPFAITQGDIKEYSNSAHVQAVQYISTTEAIIIAVVIIAVLAFFGLMAYFLFVKYKKRKENESR